jgi:hypothetical protein
MMARMCLLCGHPIPGHETKRGCREIVKDPEGIPQECGCRGGPFGEKK